MHVAEKIISKNNNNNNINNNNVIKILGAEMSAVADPGEIIDCNQQRSPLVSVKKNFD